jgi:hypothetical protein
MTEGNRLRQWFDTADADLQASYAENHAKARESKRIQQTGHAAEHAWGQLLHDWLPPHYEVAYRRYILPEIDSDNYDPRETDIVVFRPGYPQALRQKEEVLAAGVAAAFSVKLTLNAAGIKEAVEEAATIRRHVAPRLGTARQEATPPFRYGVLGHAHDFGKNSRANVASNYALADMANSQHPRESLDIICAADLGVWSKSTGTASPVWDQAQLASGIMVAKKWQVETSLLDLETSMTPNHPRLDGESFLAQSASPLSVFISVLYSFLAQEDESAEPFHRGLLGTGIYGSGSGSTRAWPLESVYNESTREIILSRIINGRDREWSMRY